MRIIGAGGDWNARVTSPSKFSIRAGLGLNVNPVDAGETRTSYVPPSGFMLRKPNRPLTSVIVVPVRSCDIATVTPRTGRPSGSVTVPLIEYKNDASKFTSASDTRFRFRTGLGMVNRQRLMVRV